MRPLRALALAAGAFAAALPWTELLLESQNTLLRDGRWIVSKRMLQLVPMGSDSYLTTRPALFRHRLNLHPWFGRQEALLRRPLRPRELHFRLRLGAGARAYALLAGAEGSFGVSLGRDGGAAEFVATDAAGGFSRRRRLTAAPLDGGWHDATLRLKDSAAALALDGVAAGEASLSVRLPARIGFRSGGPEPVEIDDVLVTDETGERIHPSFHNFRHAGRLQAVHAALLLLLALAAGAARSFRAGARLLVAAGTLGLASFAFDFLYWAGVERDPYSAPMLPPGSVDRLQPIEALRHTLLDPWHALCAGQPEVSPEDVVEQGYPPEILRGPVLCSADKPCQLGAEPAALAREPGYRILYLGGSQMLGAGAANLEETTFARLHRLLRRRLRRPIVSLNAALSGAKGEQLVEDYRRLYLPLRPDLVVISLGTNDPPERVRDALDELLRLNAKAAIKTALIAEASAPESREQLAEAGRVTRGCAARFGARFLDLRGFLDGAPLDSGFVWWDRCHLSSHGQRLAAEWLAPGLIAAIEAKR